MNNPFLNTSLLNGPFTLEQCQRIEFAAIREMEKGQFRTPFWSNNSESFSEQVGTLRYPFDLETTFAGVTTAVYCAVEMLFCSNVGRGVEMVGKTLTKMAQNTGVNPITYQAVWSLCGYLEQKRRETFDNVVEHSQTSWVLMQLQLNVRLVNRSENYSPNIVCIFDLNASRPVALRVGAPDDLTRTIGLALYDAIVTCRQPGQNYPNGLLWQLPNCLFSEVEIPTQMTLLLERELGIQVKHELRVGEAPLSLSDNWGRDLNDENLTTAQLRAIFDGYLGKIFGISPLQQCRRQDSENRDLVGFNRDPAVIFPALRLLLPEYPGVISAGDSVVLNGLHYEGTLLQLWPGQRVSLRCSAIAESTGWIYLDGEVLCQAMARELRRTDGSYRPNRPRREKNDLFQSAY